MTMKAPIRPNPSKSNIITKAKPQKLNIFFEKYKKLLSKPEVSPIPNWDDIF